MVELQSLLFWGEGKEGPAGECTRGGHMPAGSLLGAVEGYGTDMLSELQDLSTSRSHELAI